MTLAYTHNLEDWENPAQPVQSSNLFEWSDVDTIVHHYTADDNLPDGDPGENADQLPQYLRNIQNFYLTHPDRGYSIGYNAAVDWLGGTWELRGELYECAANKGWNNRTFAILHLVDGDEPQTQLAVEATRELVRQCEENAHIFLNQVGHRDIATSGTPCPGAGVYTQVHDGSFIPRPEGEQEMQTLYIGSHQREDGQWLWWIGDLSTRSYLNPGANDEELDVIVEMVAGSAGHVQLLSAATFQPVFNRTGVKAISWRQVRALGADLGSRNVEGE